MDFSFSEEQQDLQGLATQILEGELTHERLKEVEGGDENFDRELWSKLADRGRARHRGAGGAGRRRVRLPRGRARARADRSHRRADPVLRDRRLARSRSRRFGTDAQKDALLPGVADGTTIVSAALTESGADPLDPVTTATPDGDGWVLDGVKDCVPAGPLADRVLVPARTADGKVIVAIVDPTAAGVTRERQDTTNHHAEARLTLQGREGRRRRRARQRGRRRGDPRLDRRARHRRALRDRHRHLRRGGADDGRVHEDARAVRPADRHVPGGGAARRRRVHRHRGRAAHGLAGDLASLRGPARVDRGRGRRSSGPPRAGSASCTRRSTCTAGWASTATTRCTATSCGRSGSSSRSAARRRQLLTIGRHLAAEPAPV